MTDPIKDGGTVPLPLSLSARNQAPSKPGTVISMMRFYG